jgi:glutamyl-tRNA reductase
MRLLTVGLNHNTAPLALREAVAFTEPQLPESLQTLGALPGIEEGAILSTCNRTEIYAVTDGEAQPPLGDWLCQLRRLESGRLLPHLYTHSGRDSVRHTLRVAAGLDSMILGEPQILGQMKHAYRQARVAHTAGPLLSRMFQHAFSVAKLVRSSTSIGANPVSVAYAAVRLAQQIFSDFGARTAMLIGAGDTVELAARHLHDNGLGRMIFANRSVERAQLLASQYHGYAIRLDEIDKHLAEADMVISATGSDQLVLGIEAVRHALQVRKRRPMFLVDLAVPRDIDPNVAELEDAYLYTVDDLRNVIEDNLRSRQAAATAAEAIISERTEEFMAWMHSRSATGTISRLRNQAERERDEVLERARRLLAQGKSVDEVLEYVGSTLTNKLMHAPTARLRQAGPEEQRKLLEAARRLFNLGDDDK